MSTETASSSPVKIPWLIGVVAAFAIFVVIARYSGHMTRAYPSYDQKRANDRYATLAKLRADENAIINPVDDQGHPTAEWVDQSKGIIRIPIDEAMAKEVDTLKGQPTKIGSALPAPAPPAPAKPDAAKPDTAASTNAAPADSTAPAPAAKPTK